MDPITIGIGLAKFVPEIIGMFGGKKAASISKDIINIATKITGRDGVDALELIDTDIELQREFRKAVLEQKTELEKLYLEDRSNARDLQKAALISDDFIAKRFIYFFAMFVVTLVFGYIAAVTFLDVPAANRGMVDHTTGFLQGTVLASIFGYFFGTTKGSGEKQAQIKTLTAELSKMRKRE